MNDVTNPPIIGAVIRFMTSAPAEVDQRYRGDSRGGEWLGARSYVPRDLAKVKVALDHLVHEAQEGYYTAAWLEPDFAAADKAVEELLEKRRVAAGMGGAVSVACPARWTTLPGTGTGSTRTDENPLRLPRKFREPPHTGDGSRTPPPFTFRISRMRAGTIFRKSDTTQ